MTPMNANMNGSWCPPTHPHHVLKINKDSHMIKKPSSTSSSSSSSSSASQGGRPTASPPPPPPPPKPQQRHPVIIYTHSPKIIHTNPKDFMALVQKLTGLSRTEEDPTADPRHPKRKSEIKANGERNNQTDKGKVMRSNPDDNESLSGLTTSEDISSNVGDNGQVNSNCFGPSMVFHEPPNSFIGNMVVPHYNAGPNNCGELAMCCGGDPNYDFIDFNLPLN